MNMVQYFGTITQQRWMLNLKRRWKMLGSYIDPKSSFYDHVVIDIETIDPLLKISGVSWVRDIGKILGIACKIGDAKAEYYPVGHGIGSYDPDKVRLYFNDLMKVCRQDSTPVVAHFAQYDLGWLDHEKYIDIENVPPIFCTLVGSQLYNSSMQSFSLDAMSRYFKHGQTIAIDTDKLISMPVSVVAKYACNDIDLTDLLYDRLIHEELDKKAVIRENAVIPLLVMMKKQGFKVDLEYLEWLDREFQMRLHTAMTNLIKIDPQININAGASIELLFRRFAIPYQRTAHGNPSFTQGFLDSVALTNPLIADLSIARKLKRLLAFITGIKQMQHNGIIHPDYWNGKSDWGGTVTGRLSASNPNIQQMPNRTEEGKMIRGAFVSHGDAWGRADYSQQEPRIAMHYASLLHLSGIDYWLERYKNNPDQDFYQIIMERAGIDRKSAKTFTLATMYGMGAAHAGELLGIDEREAGTQLLSFHRSVPWLKELQHYVFDKVDKAHKVKTLGDRFLTFTHREPKAFNHLIQGSAADQIKQAMVNIYNETGKIPLCQVHDELNYDLNVDEIATEMDEQISRIMREAIPLQVPGKVDFTMGMS